MCVFFFIIRIRRRFKILYMKYEKESYILDWHRYVSRG